MPEHTTNDIDRFSPAKVVSENCDLIINNKSTPRPSLNDFSDIFPPSEIYRDQKTVTEIKKMFEEKYKHKSPEELEKMLHSKKRSEALEVIVAEQIELNDWFGENSLFFRTTDYDDYINHTDAVVEFDIGDHPDKLALAIDSTSHTDLVFIKDKVNRNVSKILNNSLQIKYFKSQIDGYQGSIKDIIPVVIGLEAGNTNDLIDSFAALIKIQKKINDPNISSSNKTAARTALSSLREKIVSNPTQIIFLREIQVQLEMYQKIIQRENNPDIFIKVSDITPLQNIISDILEEKKPIEQSTDTLLLKKDAVYNMINYVCKREN